MSSIAITSAMEPDGSPRERSIDILRGLAIIAILFMNVPAMGGSLWLIFGDYGRYGWTLADKIAWAAQHVLAEGTARCLLEMLFGVGMVILTDRAATAAGKWAVFRQYAWRNAVLFVFGLVHVLVLLWPGDILHTYGLAAILAVLFRRRGPKTLLAIGLSLVLFMTVGGGVGEVLGARNKAEVARIEAKRSAGQALSPVEAKAIADSAKRDAARAKREGEMAQRTVDEDRARSAATGTLASWTRAQWDAFLTLQSWGFEILFVWEAFATMLIGAALFKWGVIQGARSPRFYAIMLAAGYGIGFALRGYGAYEELALGRQSVGSATYELGRVLVTLGHISLVHLMLRGDVGRALLKPFEAAGRTALSVYIAQTLITLWVLYPPFMLGWYGQHSWAIWMLTALVVNALLVWGANQWVRRYDIAPVEWLWRSIIAGRLLPWRRGTRGCGALGAPQPA